MTLQLHFALCLHLGSNYIALVLRELYFCVL